MKNLRHHLDDYLRLRRQLGYKMEEAGILLRNFVRFAEHEGTSVIKTEMALRWAVKPDAKAAQSGCRLGMVRRFATYVSAYDARTEVPAQKLLPYPQRPSPGFFVWDGGDRLGYDSVNRWFLLVACQIGLRRPGDRRGPRVHDLRHYFAVRTLRNWYQSNVDVEAHLPELATYLGHVHVRDSYWYLSAVPELLKLATLRWERAEKGAV